MAGRLAPDDLLRALDRGGCVGVAATTGGVVLAAGHAVLPASWEALAAAEAALHPRWVWWRSATTGAALVGAGLRPRACWDLGAVSRLLTGQRRDDPAAVWAAASGRPLPAPASPELTLLDAPGDPDEPLDGAGGLSGEWAREVWSGPDADARAGRWATLALEVQRTQEGALRVLPDPRPATGEPPLAVLTAYAESAAALLAVELAADGLPVERRVVEALLTARVGPRPDGPAEEAALRAARDADVLRHFRGTADLRNPAQVRELLLEVGIDVPDTRSWRLEPLRHVPGVDALLTWRKAERLATTYGYGWLDRDVGPDGRLRGAWSAADAAAGRMTASAGLHNLPAELRPAVVAEPGHLLVRADLGQVEPRVLAAVSGDRALAEAARELDMYAPVAAQLGCDRPTAKVAVLAAMYGQTSGTAGVALRRMSRQYPDALAYLDRAEAAGREGRDVRTWGGRVVPGSGAGALPGHGRFARNAVVQGAAAELFKAWAATVRSGLAPLGGRVVLCLHDELLLHVPEAAAERAAALLPDALAATARWWAAGTGVRFVADVSVVRRWSEAKG